MTLPSNPTMTHKPNEREKKMIITEEEIERVHANANFGSLSKRKVVNDGVLKTSMGYIMGYTQLCILLEHGLVKNPKPGCYKTTLTQKGFKYLRSILSYTDLAKLADDS